MAKAKKPPQVHLGIEHPACGRRRYKACPPLTLDPDAITCQNCLNLPTRQVQLGEVFDIDERVLVVLRTMWDGVQADREDRQQEMADQRAANEIKTEVIADVLTDRFGPPKTTTTGWRSSEWWPVADGIKVGNDFARITILWWSAEDGCDYRLGADLEPDDPDLAVKAVELVAAQLIEISLCEADEAEDAAYSSPADGLIHFPDPDDATDV